MELSIGRHASGIQSDEWYGEQLVQRTVRIDSPGLMWQLRYAGEAVLRIL